MDENNPTIDPQVPEAEATLEARVAPENETVPQDRPDTELSEVPTDPVKPVKEEAPETPETIVELKNDTTSVSQEPIEASKDKPATEPEQELAPNDHYDQKGEVVFDNFDFTKNVSPETVQPKGDKETPVQLGLRQYNPGALREGLGQSRVEGGFAVFPDLTTGWNALLRQLRLYQGTQPGEKTNTAVTGDYTLAEAMEEYAPKSENNTEGYLTTLEGYFKQAGYDITRETPIKDIPTEQWAAVISRVESPQAYHVLAKSGLIPEELEAVLSPSLSAADITAADTFLSAMGADPEDAGSSEAVTASPRIVYSANGLQSYTSTGGVQRYIPYAPDFAIEGLRDTQAAYNQSGPEQILNGLVFQGILGEVFGGALEGFGALGLIGNPGGNNLLTRLGGAIREDMQAYAPIHMIDPNDAFNWEEPGWYAKNIPNVLSTFSLLIPGWGVGRALAYAGRAARLGNMYRKALRISKAQMKGHARIAEGVSSALVMRHAENTREAADVFLRAESDFLNSDIAKRDMEHTVAYSNFVADYQRPPKDKYELAEYVGDRAALESYRFNAWNLIFDLAQVGVIYRFDKAFKLAKRMKSKPKLTRRQIRKGGDATKGIKPPNWAVNTWRTVKKPAAVVGGVLTEGVEEMVNFAGAEEGIALAHRLRNQFTGTKEQRLKDYTQDDHFWESAFLGVIGGGLFTGGGLLINKKANDKLDYYKETHNAIQDYITKRAAFLKEGKVEEAEAVRKEMIAYLGQRATINGNLDQLVEQLQSEEYLDQLVRMGLGTKEELLSQQDAMIEALRAEEASVKEAVELARKNGLNEEAIGYYLTRYAQAARNVRQQEATLKELKEQGVEVPSGNRKNYARKTLLENTRTQREVLQSILDTQELDPRRRKELETLVGQLEMVEGQIESDFLIEDVEVDKIEPEKKAITDEELEATQQELGLSAYKAQLAHLSSYEGMQEIAELEEQDRAVREKRMEQLGLLTIKNTTDKKVLKDFIKRAKQLDNKVLLKAAQARLEELKKKKGGKQDPPKPPRDEENPQAVAEAEAMLANMEALTEFVLEPDDPNNPGKVPNAYFDKRNGKYYKRVSSVSNKGEVDTSKPAVETALALGKIVDNLVRDFFDGTLVKEYYLSRLMDASIPNAEERLDQFLAQLQVLAQEFADNGETVYSQNLLLVNEELGLAGSADLITVDKAGNVRIYDMKTMNHSLTDVHVSGDNKGQNKYDFGWSNKDQSKREKHQRQLSLYRIIMANSYGFVAKDISVLAIELTYPSAAKEVQTSIQNIKYLQEITHEPLDEVEGYKLDPARSEGQLRAELEPLLQELTTLEAALRLASSETDQEELDNAKVQRAKVIDRINKLLTNARLNQAIDMFAIADSILNEAIAAFVPQFVMTEAGMAMPIVDAVRKELITADQAQKNITELVVELLKQLSAGASFSKAISVLNATSEEKKVIFDPSGLEELNQIFLLNEVLSAFAEDFNIAPFRDQIARVFREISQAAEEIDSLIQREGMIVPDGVAIYLDTLFAALTKNSPLVVGDDMFGLGFLETRLREGDSLELDPEQAAVWSLILQVIDAQNAGEATHISISIEEDPGEYAAPEQVTSVKLGKGVIKKEEGLGDLKRLRHNPNNKDVTEFQYEVDPASEKDYVIYATIGSEKVRLGYLPKVNTLMGQAQRQQEAFEKESITLNLKDQMHLNTHTHAIDALVNIDRLIQFREALDAQPGGPIQLGMAEDVFKFQQLPNNQGSARGNLLRPSKNSTVKLGDITQIRDTVLERGVAVMLPDADGNIRLYSLQTGEAIDNPYQDGLYLDRDGINYGIGNIYVPVNDNGNLIYVRVPNVTLENMGIDEQVLELLQDQTLDMDTKASRLRQYTVVAGVNTVIDTGIVYDAEDKSFLLRQNGKDVFRLREGMQLSEADIQDLQMVREFAFSPSIVVSKSGELIQDLSQVDTFLGGKPLLERFLESALSPIAPVTNQAGDVLSFTYPGAPNRQEGKRYFPDTERTHIKLRIKSEDNLVPPPPPPPKPERDPLFEKSARIVVEFGGSTSILQRKLKLGYNRATKIMDQLEEAGVVGSFEDSIIVDGKKVRKVLMDEAALEKLFSKDKPTPPPDSPDPFPFGGFLTYERALASGHLNVLATDTEMAEAEAWFAENLPQIPFKRVKGLIVRGGTTAFGVWEQGMLVVSDEAVVGTEYHEAFHAVTDVYLSPARRAKLMAEADRRYTLTEKDYEAAREEIIDGNPQRDFEKQPITQEELKDYALNEKLAEEFREYMVTQGKSMKEKSVIRRFFSELYELVRSIFKGNYQMRRLMQHINKGKFAQAPSQRSAQFMTRFMKAPPFDTPTRKEFEAHLPLAISKVIDVVFEYKTILENAPDLETGIVRASDFLQKKFGAMDGAADVIAIYRGVTKLKQDIDPDTGEVVAPRAVKQQIARHMLRLAFRKYGVIHGLMHSMREEGVNTDVIDPLIEDMTSMSENLVEYFANKSAIRNRIFDALKVDAVTGTTAAEQYGGKSMEMIDPKSKIPASVRNLIGSVPMLPSSGHSNITTLLRKGGLSQAKKAELLKKLMEEIQKEGSFDKMTRTGLPRVMDFNQVFGYLLHHLNEATSFDNMMYQLEQLSVQNPNLLFLYNKLKNADKILQTQFFVSMKKANTAELNVENDVLDLWESPEETQRVLSTLPKVAKAQEPVDILTNYNRTTILQMVGEFKGDGVLSEKIDALKAAKGIEAITEALQDFGLDTIQMGALQFRISTMSLTERRELVQNFVEIVKKAEAAILATESIDKAKATNAFVARLRQNVLSQFIGVDMGAVALKYRNGEGTYVYSRMLPSYVTEEIDRLINDPAYFNERLKEDPTLASTSWVFVGRDGAQRNPKMSHAHSRFILRFGHHLGRSYTRLKPHQKLAYDLNILYHEVDGGRSKDGHKLTIDASYVAVPTPSDAENTWVVKSFWHMLEPNEKRELLNRIAKEEKSLGPNSSIPGLYEAKDAVEHMKQHWDREVDMILADPKLSQAAQNFVRNRLTRIAKEPIDINAKDLLVKGYTFMDHVREHLNDLVVATWISHRDYAHWISGVWSQFDFDTVQMQKRAKGPQSNGTSNSRQTSKLRDRQKFRAIVVKEPKTTLDWVDSDVKRADGVTYMTLEFYRDLLEDHGELTKPKQIAIDKALNNEPLNERDTIALITPYKPMYFGHSGRNKYYLKTAVLPLVPGLLRNKDGSPVEGREGLANLLAYLEKKELDQAHVESVQKEGPYTAVELFDAEGNFIEARMDEGIADVVLELPVDHYRHQVHNPQHMSPNNTTGWLTQLSKIIHGNLHGRQRVGKRGYTGTKMVNELLRKEAKLLNMKREELINKFFETEKDENGNSVIKYDGVVPVFRGNNLREFLLDHVDEQNQALVALLQSPDASLDNPMFAMPMANALFAILHRDYKHLKIPGGMQVQMPDLGIKDGLKGMRVEGDTVLPAEVIVPRNFLPEEYRNSPVEAIPDRILTMLAYRIPGEHKNSAAVIKVVGFMPEGSDGMLVPPDFIEQMGSDFDNDKLYLNWKKYGDNLSAYHQVWNEYLDLVFDVLTDKNVFLEEVRQSQDFAILRDFRETQQAAGRLPGRELDGINLDTYVSENPYSYVSHMRMLQDNLAGIGLKGISAKNNTFWLNMQRYKIRIPLETELLLPDGTAITTVTWNTLDKDRLRFDAQTVGASMDGAKDPVYGQLGIGLHNFQIWQDLYMIGYSMEDAWKAATHPDSVAFLENELEEDEIIEKMSNGGWELSAVVTWKTELSIKLEPVKQLMRLQEEKLKNMGTSFVPILTGEQSFEGIESILSDGGSELDITHLPVIKENLDIAQVTLDLLQALNIPYFAEPLDPAEQITFEMSDRHQKYMAAKAFISMRRAKGAKSYLRMGQMVGVENVSGVRPARKKGQYHTWHIQDFLDYFKSNAGRKKVKADPSLKFILENLYIRNDAMPGGKDLFGSNSMTRFLDLNHHQRLHDSEMGQDFTEAWKSISESPDNAVREFAYALAEYEAERSGWRFGADTLTKFVPEIFFRDLERPLQDALEIKLLAAQNPKIMELFGDKRVSKAERRNDMVSVTIGSTQRVYFTANGERGYITRPAKRHGVFEDRTMSEMVDEFQASVEEIESRNARPNEGEESRKALSKRPEKQFEERKARLTQIFRDAGIPVKVILDSTITGAGGVEFVDGKAEIRIHPDRMRGDTLIHEFAHIYIELLGYNHPLVQQAIQELRGTKLYKETQLLYPDKTQKKLDMEVLASAMGLKGDTVYAEELGTNKIQTIFRRIFRAISKVLGRIMGREVKTDTAEMLARNMFRGKDIHVNKLITFSEEQRLKEHLSEVEMLLGVREVISERLQHMRRLGITEDEEIKLMENLMTSNKSLAGITDDMRSQVVGRVNEVITLVVADTNNILEQSEGYIQNLAGREWTEGDRLFYNRAYNARQILLNLHQAALGFNPDAPGERSRASSKDIRRLAELGDTVGGQIQRLDRVLKEAISEKLKHASADPIIRNLAGNIFDLADDGELWKYALDSGFFEEGFLGTKEQSSVVVKLLSLQVKRTLDKHALIGKQQITELTKLSKRFLDSGLNWESLLDEDKKRFISPVLGKYYQDRENAKDRRIFEAENTIQEFTPEYYIGYKYRKRTEEYQQAEQEIAILKENRERLGVLTEEETLRLQELELSISENKIWSKYHKFETDQKAYTADRRAAAAKGEEALAAFDAEFTQIHKGRRQIKGFTKYKVEVVRPEYINDKWDPNGGLQVIDKYKNDKYDQLSDLQKETIQGLKTLMREALGRDHMFFDQNLIPQFSKADITLVQELKAKGKSLTTITGEELRERLDAEDKPIYIRENPSFLYTKKNQKVMTNLLESVAEFIGAAQSQKALDTIETFALASRDQIDKMRLVSSNTNSFSITGFGKESTKRRKTIAGRESRAKKSLEHMLQGYFGQGWVDQAQLDKIIQMILTYNSMMGIGLNTSAWLNNALYGTIQQRIESIGGVDYSRKDARKAMKLMTANIGDVFKLRKATFVPPTKAVGLIKFFDVTMDQTEVSYLRDRVGVAMNWIFIGQNFGETVMQNQVMLASLMGQKVILADGTETNLYDALDYSMEGGIVVPEGAKIVRPYGEVALTLDELANFKQKMLSKLQRIHGAYNKEDQGTVARHSLGQAGLQYRKWMPHGIVKRFGGDRFSEAREENEIGWYRALYDVLGTLIQTSLTERQFAKYSMIAEIYKDKPHVLTSAKRGLAEIAIGVASWAALTILSSMIKIDPNDDDELWAINDEFYKAKMLYHIERLKKEMFTFISPTEISDTLKRIGKDPIPAGRTVGFLLAALAEVLKYGASGEWDRFEGGFRYGQVKAASYAKRGVFGFKHYLKGEEMISNYQAYSLTN